MNPTNPSRRSASLASALAREVARRCRACCAPSPPFDPLYSTASFIGSEETAPDTDPRLAPLRVLAGLYAASVLPGTLRVGGFQLLTLLALHLSGSVTQAVGVALWWAAEEIERLSPRRVSPCQVALWWAAEKIERLSPRPPTTGTPS